MKSEKKPLGRRNYGHIPHLPNSRIGPGDHKCHEGQARIATIKTRDKNDTVIVQEKLDGSNVGIARIDGELYPLGRAGYLAISSPYQQHRTFASWVYKNNDRFMRVLKDGERLVGEWLIQAHGTRYDLHHEPFVVFDLMIDSKRLPFKELNSRIRLARLTRPYLLWMEREARSVEQILIRLGDHGFHGALDQVEGAVWRVERDKPTGKKGEKVRVVDFLCKYVRPDKIDGKYLESQTGEDAVWNTYPASS